LKRESGRSPLAERLTVIAHDLKARAGKDGQPVNKDEIDDLWGRTERPGNDFSRTDLT
jgi:antitoxin VapB